MKRASVLFVLLAGLAVSACDSSKPDKAAAEPALTSQPTANAKGAPSSAQAGNAASGSVAPAPAPSAATAAAAAVGNAQAKGGPPKFEGTFPDTETKPPTVKEWGADAKIYIVKHSSSLWCETLALREWIRVSCRAKPGAPNQPLTVSAVKAPKKGQHYMLSRNGVTSLVLQPRKGQTSEFKFQWSNWGDRTLTVTFPENEEKPVLAFDKPGPAGKSGLPKCDDVCSVGLMHHNWMSDCSFPCAEGYQCKWWEDAGERTAMCECATECSYSDD